MAKKITDTAAAKTTEVERAAAEPETMQPSKPEGANTEPAPAAETTPSGFYCYIGPNLKGLIQTGSIYRGDRANALRKAEKAIAQYPLVKSLIVSGDALPSARLKVKHPGNALYANYQKLAGK